MCVAMVEYGFRGFTDRLLIKVGRAEWDASEGAWDQGSDFKVV